MLVSINRIPINYVSNTLLASLHNIEILCRHLQTQPLLLPRSFNTVQITFHFHHLSPFINHSPSTNHETICSFEPSTTVDALLQNILTIHWFNPEATIAILTTIPQLTSTHIHKFTTLAEIGTHLTVTEASPQTIGSIFFDFESLGSMSFQLVLIVGNKISRQSNLPPFHLDGARLQCIHCVRPSYAHVSCEEERRYLGWLIRPCLWPGRHIRQQLQ